MSCIVSSSFIEVDNEPNVVMLLRDKDYKRTKLFIPFDPYFYVREFDCDKLREYLGNELYCHIKNMRSGPRGLDGFKLKKVTMSDPHDIGEVNKHLNGTDIILYESNIPYNYRYLIDNNLVTGINPETNEAVDVESLHKIAFIDIEVFKDSKPNYKVDPITIIGLFDYVTKKYYSLYVGSKKYDFDLSVIKTAYKDIEFIPCKNEVDLLDKFAKVWLTIEPDIIVSFSDFDMPYVVNRLEVNYIDSKFLSPVFNVRCNKVTNALKIGCIHVVDFALVYRKVMGEPVWNTLDYISKEELGYGKLEVKSFVEMWKHDRKSLIEYNLRDVELLVDLEDKIGVLNNYLLPIWKCTGLELEDCLMPNSIADILHLRHVHKLGIALFSKSPHSFIEYDGALVGGKIGKHDNVCVLDWNELYPTIMEMFNISLDTFDLQYGIKLLDEKNELLNAGFCTEPVGWTVQIMKPLRAYRQSVKKQSKVAIDDNDKRRLKLLSSSVKAVVNSLYGVYGQKTDKFTSRFYDPRIANAICLVGRILNREARKIVEELGYEWVYYDTDSLFIKLKGVDGEVDLLKNTIEEKLRVFLKDNYNVTSLMRLDYEYTFKSMLVLAKKKYIGMPINSTKAVVKGLSIIQKNTAEITSFNERKVAEMRLNGMSIKELKSYILKQYYRVKMGKEPIEKIMVKARLNRKYYPRATSALKATIYAKQKYGLEIPLGERFYWVYIHPKNDSIKALYDGVYKDYPASIIAFKDPAELPSDIVIDYKKMADRVIKKPLKHYIEEEDKSNQRELSSFFT